MFKKVLTKIGKYTRMSSSSTKSLLFGVFASAMIASFALASENAHVLLHQVRAFRFVSFFFFFFFAKVY